MHYDAVYCQSPLYEDQAEAYTNFTDSVMRQRGATERACLLQKVHGEPRFCIGRSFRPEVLTYACNLAEFMGFGSGSPRKGMGEGHIIRPAHGGIQKYI